MGTWLIQQAEEKDIISMSHVYQSAIRAIGKEYYSPEQIAAWASYPDDKAKFKRWVQQASTFVALAENSELVGFGGLEKTGRISSIFVEPGSMRQGIASALLTHLFAEAELADIGVLTTHASEFSKPLFIKFGFEVINIESTNLNGVDFTRYFMRKGLSCSTE
ncbi:GNAT family N-acetyltransferase [Candidatus Nitrospira salsa]